MPDRREFILQSLAAGSAMTVLHSPSSIAGENQRLVKPLRVLILGGTGFIGPAFVQVALERGHNVSVFNRGKEQADLPPDVERLIGDRNGDLKALEKREWDAVFDLATYVPAWVRSLGATIKDRTRHYTLISTIMVYKFPGAIDEKSTLMTYSGKIDPYAATSPGDQYGALKVLCEEEAERQFPGRSLVLRPGHIVGPRARVGALTYWLARLEKGGEVIAAGDPLAQVQLIDAKDLAEWAVRLAEQRITGAFNAVGPALSLGWAELLGAIRALFSVPTQLTWVPVPWLEQRQLKPSSALLFWPTEFGLPGFTQLRNEKALAHGLRFRPMHVTAADTLRWYQGLPENQQKEVLLGVDAKNKTLEESMARERELLAAWKANPSATERK